MRTRSRYRSHERHVPSLAPDGTGVADSHASLTALTLAAFLGFVVLALVLYRGIWDSGFYKDDYHWLLVARGVAQDPLTLFAADPLNPEVALRVTQRLVMGVTWMFFGLSGPAHHLVSLLLHAVCSTVVFRLLLALHLRVGAPSLRAALLLAGAGGVIFASSHHHAMAVLWLSAQSGVLAATALAGLSLYLVGKDSFGLRPRWMIVSVGLFLLALYSKNTVVAFPLVVAAAGWLAPFGEGNARRRKTWLLLAALLAAISVTHLVFTKLVLFGGSWSAVSEKAALSTNVLRNLSGALLAPFLSAADFEAVTRGTIPHPIAALLFAGALLALARALGVFRPVAWGLVWILVLALPVSFMNYDQYDPVQLTVTRYYYAPMIGAAIVLSFLLRGLALRRSHRRWGLALAIALVSGHVLLHGMSLQRELGILRGWGRDAQALVDKTLERAEQFMAPGTVIYAVDWPNEAAFVRCVGALYIEPAGFGWRVPEEPRRLVQEFRAGSLGTAWVAVYDAPNQRFGAMPMQDFVQWLESRSP